MVPKRRFWTVEKHVGNTFCKSFSSLSSQEEYLGVLKDNLHSEHFDKSVNNESTLKYFSKCSKWRLSKKRGLVADDWGKPHASLSLSLQEHVYGSKTKILDRRKICG